MPSPRPSKIRAKDEHARRRTGGRADARRLRAVSRIFLAAGDADRLRLLVLLFDGPMSASDLAEATARTAALVSQQMRVLRDAEIVRGRRDGRRIVYAIAHARMRRLLETCLAHASSSARRG